MTVANNPFVDGNKVILTGSGTPPAPLSNGTIYYVQGTSGNNFKLSRTLGGTAINLTSSGNSPLTLTSTLGTGVTYYVRDVEAVNNVLGTQRFKVTTSSGGNAIDLTSVSAGSYGLGINLSLRATNTYADNRVQVYNLSDLGLSSGDTRVLSGTITLRANCGSSSGAVCAPVTPTGIPATRLGPSPVFILKGSAAENIVFSSLKVKLDGVNPNNVFGLCLELRLAIRLQPLRERV